MLNFKTAVERVERTGLPTVEGFAVKLVGNNANVVEDSVRTRLNKELPGFDWQSSPGPGGWRIFRPGSAATNGLWPSLGEGWEQARRLRMDTADGVAEVKDAEPLLVTRVPVTGGAEAQQRFRLWGRVNDRRLQEIERASREPLWALSDLGIFDRTVDAEPQRGAWTIWKAKAGNEDRTPGDGVLVAHPDTGYQKHPQLLEHLDFASDGSSGLNFVERDRPDALDPIENRGFLQFPGHGTSTASVISCTHLDGQPGSVAPGAKILPLRVSSTVVHLSWGNLNDAIEAAIERKAHVISMSLGGPFGPKFLHETLERAMDAGIIVVAAAGNFVPSVAFPARVPGVIACAASNAVRAPWRFSGMGTDVVITAPGELVHHLQVDPGDPITTTARASSGTSFATAHVAGLAALWLSYWGRDALVAKYGDAKYIPHAFRVALTRSADSTPGFIRRGKGGFGGGIANAEKLLRMSMADEDTEEWSEGLPTFKAVEQELVRVAKIREKRIVDFPVTTWGLILSLPTLAPGEVALPTEDDAKERDERLHGFAEALLRTEPDPSDLLELGVLSSSDPVLQGAFSQAARTAHNGARARAVRRYLLMRDRAPAAVAPDQEVASPTAAPNQEATRILSDSLRQKLDAAREQDRTDRLAGWKQLHTGLFIDDPDATGATALRAASGEGGGGEGGSGEGGSGGVGGPPGGGGGGGGGTTGTGSGPVKPSQTQAPKSPYDPPTPPTRRLRAFAFDPSLATNREFAGISRITIPVVYEPGLLPGPVGDYLEVVDVDPASGCVYAPVDLNHPYLLACDGLPPSEGNPQFHQQMVYAVAMKTIRHFEEALGRPLFWSPLRPWRTGTADESNAANVRYADGEKDERDQFVRRLRLYPHALRDQNAYYSPEKRAILFGYFPAGDSEPGSEYPGGIVFTCLAHDIIAHEMTHAILDGMHVYFTEPSNPDVFAFHEAFADIVALFERFTYPELLKDQIARSRGSLSSGTLMSQLALQFGRATGRRHALRDALGYVVRQSRTKSAGEFGDQRPSPDANGQERGPNIEDAAYEFDEISRDQWKRFQADPSLLAQVEEPHDRGSFLVAAVFDAFLCIYEDRIEKLKRIATGGSGVLPDGELHPDVVDLMANEAAKSARHVLRMCIRAMDYVPPTDLTYGDYLRALITADADLVPDDPLRYRVAIIDAFRKWGIYPRDVRTLSEESLRWSPPDTGCEFLFSQDEDTKEAKAIRRVRRALLAWAPGRPREDVFKMLLEAQAELNSYFRSGSSPAVKQLLGSIDLTKPKSIEVTNLRPARRIGPNGEFLTEMVVEIIQKQPLCGPGDAGQAEGSWMFRGGVTLVVSLDDFRVLYAIEKRMDSAGRKARQQAFVFGASGGGEAAEYSSEGLPDGWFTDPSVRDELLKKRHQDRESMRASSCACRRVSMNKKEESARKSPIAVPNSLTEPFALLHRG